MNSYKVFGTINSRPIKTKYFKNSDKALRHLDKLVTDLDVQIEEVIDIEETITTFVANNYTRLSLAKID